MYAFCYQVGSEFYFAGHGHEDDRGHLLLAADVRFRELQAGMAPDVIPVRGLEKMTAGYSERYLPDNRGSYIGCRLALSLCDVVDT